MLLFHMFYINNINWQQTLCFPETMFELFLLETVLLRDHVRESAVTGFAHYSAGQFWHCLASRTQR